MLRGLSLFVDTMFAGIGGGANGLSCSIVSLVALSAFTNESEDGLDGIVVWVLEGRDQSCEPKDESEPGLVCDTIDALDSNCEFNVCSDASEFDRNESDKLSGRPFINEALLLEAGDCDSQSIELCLLLSSERVRMNDMVFDLLSARFSSSSSGVASFFSGSGSLNSSFPFLSDAKNSFPRPNTTCRLAKSRLEAFAKRKSFKSGGRSWPS
jgi:hypothetical protein